MPSKLKESIVKELRRLSMKNDDNDDADDAGDDVFSKNVSEEWKKRAVSSYQNNYQPLAAGVRTNLWFDGFRQREERKKGGFKHFKLEWMAPTARGKDSPQPEVVSPNHRTESEPLFLLPTKLEKKRIQLQKMYERKARKKIANEFADKFPGKEKPKQTEKSRVGLSDYEKNRLNNMQSHIVLPTFSSCATTARSAATKSSSRRSGSTRRSRQNVIKNNLTHVKNDEHQQEKLMPSPTKQHYQQQQQPQQPVKQRSPVKQPKNSSPTKQQQPKHQSPMKQHQQQPRKQHPKDGSP